MPTSRASKILQGTAVTALTSVGAFFVWTKHCKWIDLSPATDPTFRSVFYKKFNPEVNPTTHDLCSRKIPIFKLRPDLVQDAQNGGTKLVEAFCAGVWGGFGYAPQRIYLSNKYKNETTTVHQLWTKKQLLGSKYDEGTEITDHFAVLSKTTSSSSQPSSILSLLPSALKPSPKPSPSPSPSSTSTAPTTQTILIRCGDSPLNSPDSARPSDGLFEISTILDSDRGFAEFRLKSIFYQGLGKSESGKAPMEVGSFILWAHRQYTKLWMESAVRNCKN